MKFAMTLATALTAVVALSAGRADALSIKLVDLNGMDPDLIVADNGLLDLDSTAGSMTLVNLGFAGFTTSTSIAGATTGPVDELFGQLFAMSTTGGVGIRLYVSETGFSAGSAGGSYEFALTSNPGAQADVTVRSFVNGSNTLFATETEIGSVSSSDRISGKEDGAGLLGLTGPYSVTHMIEVTHAVAAMSNGDAQYVSSVPVPAAFPMLLGGVAGLAAFGRRRRGAA